MLAQSARIGVAQGEGQQSQHHDLQIFHAIGHGGGGVLRGALACEIQTDQPLPENQEDRRSQCADEQPHHKLGPEGIPDALVVLPSLELGGENARAGGRTEDAEVEHEQQLIDDGNAAHGDRAHLPHHHIVQHLDKIGDAILDHHGQRHRENAAVEMFFFHIFPSKPKRIHVIARLIEPWQSPGSSVRLHRTAPQNLRDCHVGASPLLAMTRHDVFISEFRQPRGQRWHPFRPSSAPCRPPASSGFWRAPGCARGRPH